MMNNYSPSLISTLECPNSPNNRETQETALADSRRFLQCTLDALSAHIAILDEHGIIIEVNAAWIRFARENGLNGGRHGLGDNYLKICETADGDHSEQALQMAKGIRAVMAGETSEFCLEYPCHTPQQQRWFIGRATRFTGAGPVRVVMAHENITERKQADDALHWKTGFLEAQVNTLIDGILITDQQGRKLLQNQQLANLFDIPPSIVEDNEHAKQLQWTANRTKNPEAFVEKVAYLYAHPSEITRDEIELKGGIFLDRCTSPVIGPDGTYYGRLWSFRDITAPKRAESELRKLSYAVEQSPVSIVITDLLGGIEYVNPKFCTLTGYSFEEVSGKNARVLKSGKMSVESYRQMWAAVAAGEEWRGEFHNRKKNGELFWESASISPIRDEQGKVTHFVAIKEDITERKRVSACLIDSQQNLALATESAHIGIWDWDVVANRKIWDPRMYALYGLREQDISNPIDVWQKSVHPADWNRVEAEMTSALGGIKDFNTEFRILWPNGEVRHIEAHGMVRRTASGSAARMIGVNWDITERKQAEGALKEQLALRERLAKIAANTPGIIYSFRLRRDGSTCVPYASPTIGEFFGVLPEDLEADASSLLDLIDPGDRPDVDDSIAESARTLRPWHAEFRVRHPKKGVFWVEGQSTPDREPDGSILWHGFMSDITGRKQTEETLRVKEHLLSESQRLGHVGSWLSDANGPIAWSEETYRIYGVSAETFTPSMESLLGLVHPDDRQVVQVWQTRCAAGEKPQELEFRINRPDGAIRYIRRNGEAVYDAQNRFVHMAGTTHDITESKQAKAERKNLELRVAEHKASEESARLALEHEQKLSQTKSRFVSMVSHEFRTPLSVINMAAELLDAYCDRMSRAERSDQLQEILGAVGRMTQMMTDFLVHGASTSGKMECNPTRVIVEDLCRHLIAEATSHSTSPRTIELLVAPAIGESFLDEIIFRHILGNLLSNALKYSSDGQPVKLEVRRVAGSPRTNGGTDTPSETHLEFKVSDSGIGIPAADLAKLYQTFHRAANVGNRPGTGMGLAIVKQFVDLHRGTIRFESKEGKGTTVWVHLPVALPASRNRI